MSLKPKSDIIWNEEKCYYKNECSLLILVLKLIFTYNFNTFGENGCLWVIYNSTMILLENINLIFSHIRFYRHDALYNLKDIIHTNFDVKKLVPQNKIPYLINIRISSLIFSSISIYREDALYNFKDISLNTY